MTDNEIIKALECCSTTMKLDCKDCPYMISYADCRANRMKKDAIDLITRQKAEIERLEKELENERGLTLGRQTRILALKAEIEEYEKVVGKLGRKDGKVVCVLKGKETEYIPTSIANVHKKLAISKAKAEAIKEFAERLKAKSQEYMHEGYVDSFDIDNLVKEVVGDSQ